MPAVVRGERVKVRLAFTKLIAPDASSQYMRHSRGFSLVGMSGLTPAVWCALESIRTDDDIMQTEVLAFSKLSHDRKPSGEHNSPCVRSDVYDLPMNKRPM